jgi:hypothetical protein
MALYNQTYNYTNETERDVLVGLIDLLNKNIFYINKGSDNESLVSVPFFLSFSNNQRYIQNYFDTDEMRKFIKADGQYDQLPRGIIQYMGESSVQSDELVNPYIRGYIQKEENGRLVDYYAVIRSIPFTLNLDINIYVDNIISAIKIKSKLKRSFYRTKKYEIQSDGLRIPCLVTFPESYSKDTSLDVSIGDDSIANIFFQLEVRSFLYDIMEETKIFNGDRMATIHNTVTVVPQIKNK